MVVRLKIYEDDNGVLIGDLSTRGDQEAVNEEKSVLSRLLDVSMPAGEGILGMVYTRSNAPAEIGDARFGEPWGRTIYGSEVEGRIDFHPLQTRPSLWPSIKMKASGVRHTVSGRTTGAVPAVGQWPPADLPTECKSMFHFNGA
jgi:hypothetical protein